MSRPSLKGEKDEKLESRHRKSKLQEETTLKAYKDSYKNILWIDDRSDSGAGNKNEIDWMKDWLKDASELWHIEQVNLFQDAVKKIIEDYSQYDLVIFDINLEKGFMESTDNPEELTEDFQKYHIFFNYDDISSEEGVKTAGIYLYLLLLSKGYPLKRMLIYTGNGIEAMNDIIKKKLGYFNFDDSIYKTKKDKSFSTEEYFNKKEDLYYRIRRLVFQACNHWKKWLKDIETEEEKSKAKKEKAEEEEKSKTEKISFNRIYFSNNPEQKISPESFLEMLDRIKMLFPVVQPSETECNRIYYHALQMAAMIHEESAKIEKTKNLFCYPWHSMIRNFRNWSAHNKLGKASIDGEQFALLFCVALRTFFDEKQKTEFSGFYPYEEVFDFTCTYGESGHMETKNFSITNENLRRTLHKNWNELFNIGWADASCLSGGLSKLTYSIPQNVKKTLKKKHLFIPIWCTYYDKNEKDNRIKDSINVTKECASDFSKLEDSVSIFYKWEPKEDILNNICDKANTKNLTPEAVFMRYCYRWLTEE